MAVARDSTVALHWIGTIDEAIDGQTVNEKFWSVLAMAYADTAFLLAITGLYGVLSHNVATRKQEMGVRLALGATAQAIAWLVVNEGLRLILPGIAIGLAITLAFGRLLQSRLFGVAPTDPWSLMASAAALAVVGLAACWLPARRAIRTDPMIALRAE